MIYDNHGQGLPVAIPHLAERCRGFAAASCLTDSAAADSLQGKTVKRLTYFSTGMTHLRYIIYHLTLYILTIILFPGSS